LLGLREALGVIFRTKSQDGLVTVMVTRTA
jgi:hypothetical protein